MCLRTYSFSFRLLECSKLQACKRKGGREGVRGRERKKDRAMEDGIHGNKKVTAMCIICEHNLALSSYHFHG